MKRTDVVALVAGLLFAVGLALSGMTQPEKVIGFLDVAGHWDPSLALVMMGAIGVHVIFARIALRAGAPRFAPRFALPSETTIDRRLVAGAALFGLGWGIAGFCPGPAVVSVVKLAPEALALVAAMLVGMFAFERVRRPRAVSAPNAVDDAA